MAEIALVRHEGKGSDFIQFSLSKGCLYKRLDRTFAKIFIPY
jgi:hypothetical protein